MDTTRRFDLAVVGAGLQGGLIALGALAHDPARRIALIERDPQPGGNHTWCLHADDVPAEARHWVDPLIVQRWAGYDVRFPTQPRTVTGRYSAVSSARFAEHVLGVLAHAPNARGFFRRNVTQLGPRAVLLEGGEVITADLVVDARGAERDAFVGARGFQKFLGLELDFEGCHGLARPILMDATVPQLGGYRFFRVLPFGPRRLLIEDISFALDPALDAAAARCAVLEYAQRLGRVVSVVREEHGVLPMPFSGPPPLPHASPLRAGYRGGFFHPATGDSFPAAIRLAQHLATRPSRAVFDRAFESLCAVHTGQFAFAQGLNRLLFHCFAPEDMWRVFDRFYRLPDALIHRFHAMTLSRADRARVLVGGSPRGLRLGAALAAVRS